MDLNSKFLNIYLKGDKKMNILITGGAGFIGSNFITYLIENYPEYKLFCFDKLTYAGDLRNLDDVLNNPRFLFEKGDISDKNDIEELFGKYQFDMVVNFAAETHVDRSIESSEEFINSNIYGVHVLLDACKKYNVKRFHQVSTDEVYGDIKDNNNSFVEEDVLNPSSPYSASKAAAEMLILSYKKTFNLPVTISRCSNNYGRYQFPEKLIPKTIINAMQNLSIPIYGTGTNTRDWIHVDDHCRAIDLILHSSSEGNIYNIGSGNVYSNIQVVKTILELINKSNSLIEFVPDRLGHDFGYSINSKKIESEINWKASTDFKIGLKNTIDWYVQNIDRWIK